MSLGLRFFLAATAVCIASVGVIYWRSVQLPAPDVANGNQLGHWLIRRVLDDESQELKLALVSRFSDDPDILTTHLRTTRNLSLSQREQLAANLETLQEAWFLDRVQQYADVPRSERQKFFEIQVADVKRWAALLEPYMASQEFRGPARNINAPLEQESSAICFHVIDRLVDNVPNNYQHRAFTAMMRAIWHWLSTESLENYPLKTRRIVARKVEMESHYTGRSRHRYNDLEPGSKQLLADNMELLLEAWLLGKASHLANITEETQRVSYADEVLKRLLSWKFAPDSNDDASLSEGIDFQMLKRFKDMAEIWLERADPVAASQLTSLLVELELRMLRYSFPFLRPVLTGEPIPHQRRPQAVTN